MEGNFVMSFLRCPKCNNYSAKINTTMTNFESCLSFLGFFLIIPGFLMLRHYAKRDELQFINGENDAGCKICGHRFIIQEAPELPPDIGKELVWQLFQKELEKKESEPPLQDSPEKYLH